MDKIVLSSRVTYLWKVFPYIGLPYLVGWTIYGWADHFMPFSAVPNSFGLFKLTLFTILTFVFGLVSIRVFLPLKTVELYGEFLNIRTLWNNTKMPLSEVTQVDGPDATTLRRITIEFESASKFGRSVTFVPALFRANSIADTLRRQIRY